MASAGVAARRKADELIVAGRVQVNDRVVTTLGITIDPTRDRVSVDGVLVRPQREIVVYALYKPRGVVSTMDDPQGRKTIAALVPAEPRVFPIGRLDQASEGLLLLTNDGDLALRLTHPRFEHVKQYRVSTSVPHQLDMESLLNRVRTPRFLDGRRRSFDQVVYVGRDTHGLVFDVEVHEGMKHLVRRLFDQAGLTTLRLVRTAHGPVELGTLKPGEWRRVDLEELKDVQNPKNA
ncbi:rRNA pseudouridine synthase [Candidatus Berkelbacteria bacterium]|nr:rRNA pseudouridine synthase [Candidatus Berkelbacteria bacterium]